MRATLTLLLALSAALCWHQAQAHGGGLHDWDWSSPDHANYTRVQLATVGNFSFYDASISSSFLPGSIPFYPSYALPASVTGSITIWEYLDDSCRETAALSINITITAANKKPVANEKVYVYTMTGNCTTGVQGVYMHNLTAGDSRLNMLWAARESVFTNSSGVLWGSTPNVFFPRSKPTAEGPGMTSVLLSFAPDVSPFLCAPINWATVDLAAWAAKVKSCKPSSDGGAHGRRRQARRALTAH